jgi:hypothetical protein
LSQKNTYNIDDLISISNSKFGFLKTDGSINEYYGDIDCTSPENSFFDFNVGCGSEGDIISIVIKTNTDKLNTFDLYIPIDEIYYGETTTTEIKIGELNLLSESKINGNIKLCLNKSDGCCGEEGEVFTLVKINQ